jgi:hypothetical protein
LGWTATFVMAAVTVAMFATMGYSGLEPDRP